VFLDVGNVVRVGTGECNVELNVTFLIQLVAFLFTVVMLSQLAFAPLLKTLDERKERIEGARHEAARLAQASGYQAETIVRKLADARRQGQEILGALKIEGEKQEAQLLTTAKGQANQQIDEARRSLQEASVQARDDLRKNAEQLAQAIAHKALGRNA
jgi:F-type H+-transporting ATPase subunit b